MSVFIDSFALDEAVRAAGGLRDAQTSPDTSITRRGLNRRTGKIVVGWAHVIQSIEDILRTLRLTRLMVRAYGSNVPNLIDASMNDETLMDFYTATAEALDAWEPGFDLNDIGFTAASADGSAILRLAGVYYPRGHVGDRSPDGAQDVSIDYVLTNEFGFTALN